MSRVSKAPKLMILGNTFLGSYISFLLQMPTGITSALSKFILNQNNSEIFLVPKKSHRKNLISSKINVASSAIWQTL